MGGALVELPRDSLQDDGFHRPQSSSGLECVALVSGCPQHGMILSLSCEGPQGPQNQPFLKPLFAIPDDKGFVGVAMNPDPCQGEPCQHL